MHPAIVASRVVMQPGRGWHHYELRGNLLTGLAVWTVVPPGVEQSWGDAPCPPSPPPAPTNPVCCLLAVRSAAWLC